MIELSDKAKERLQEMAATTISAAERHVQKFTPEQRAAAVNRVSILLCELASGAAQLFPPKDKPKRKAWWLRVADWLEGRKA